MWRWCNEVHSGEVDVMQAEAVVTREAEFAGPAWMFGSRSYQVLPDGRSVHQTCIIMRNNVERPARSSLQCLLHPRWFICWGPAVSLL